MIQIQLSKDIRVPVIGSCLLCQKDLYEQNVCFPFDEYYVCSKKCRRDLAMLLPVSLDPYRTKGVRIFSGEDRGKVVAEKIAEDYGNNPAIIIPSDVSTISNSFRRGFNNVMVGKFPYNKPLYKMPKLLR